MNMQQANNVVLAAYAHVKARRDAEHTRIREIHQSGSKNECDAADESRVRMPFEIEIFATVLAAVLGKL